MKYSSVFIDDEFDSLLESFNQVFFISGSFCFILRVQNTPMIVITILLLFWKIIGIQYTTSFPYSVISDFTRQNNVADGVSMQNSILPMKYVS